MPIPLHEDIDRLTKNQVRWLISGERGVSSNTILKHLTGFDATDWDYTPSDPDDLTRCIRLLEEVPELMPLFRSEMPAVSKEWATLVAGWDELVSLFEQEAPGWRGGRGWRAPRTYQRMKDLGL